MLRHFLFLLLLMPMQAFAVSYVENKALSSVVSGRVGDVRNASTIDVPIISWGGDIATIHANGDTTITKSGSLFDKLGLNMRLVREDIFAKQVQSYMSGKTPYLRGTIGMINQAADILAKDPRTQPVIIYQMTWSAGGDALVVKDNIQTAKDLKGKTIALQAYGPHTDYLIRVLKDAGLSQNDVKIKWTRDLTGTSETPVEALYESGVDAAFMIIPDALALTSGGSVGTGAESSIKGAKILLSTKTANRVIADVYAVRSDYFKSNRSNVEKFVRGLLQGQESLSRLVKDKSQRSKEYNTMIRAAAKALLDSEQAVSDAEGMYADAEFLGFNGNVKVFQEATFPRRIEVLNKEAQAGLAQLALVKGTANIAKADWDFGFLKTGLKDTAKVEAPKFDESKVASMISRRQQQGALQQGELFQFEVFFKPNEKSFSADLYKDAFEKVIDLASTYGGAIITVEGHSDPLGYLKNKKSGAPQVVLGRVKQSARNLSLGRAQSVRDNIINFAKAKTIYLDPSQFAIVGHGISSPRTGYCGDDPCAPKTEEEWRSNMRVVFRIIQVEAEESVFKPL